MTTDVVVSRDNRVQTLRLTRPISERDVQVDPAIADGLERTGV